MKKRCRLTYVQNFSLFRACTRVLLSIPHLLPPVPNQHSRPAPNTVSWWICEPIATQINSRCIAIPFPSRIPVARHSNSCRFMYCLPPTTSNTVSGHLPIRFGLVKRRHLWQTVPHRHIGTMSSLLSRRALATTGVGAPAVRKFSIGTIRLEFPHGSFDLSAILSKMSNVGAIRPFDVDLLAIEKADDVAAISLSQRSTDAVRANGQLCRKLYHCMVFHDSFAVFKSIRQAQPA